MELGADETEYSTGRRHHLDLAEFHLGLYDQKTQTSRTSRTMTTSTSRPVSTSFPSYNPSPLIEARPR